MFTRRENIRSVFRGTMGHCAWVNVFLCRPLDKISEMEQEDPYLNDRCRGESLPVPPRPLWWLTRPREELGYSLGV